MFKNVAGQTVEFFVFDYTTGAPKTGDAANLTKYLSKDDGTLTALTDTSAAEISSTNAPGWYRCDVSQTESNANKLLFTGKSSTSNVAVVGRVIYTRPQYAADMVIDSSGRLDVSKVSGTAQTAKDIGAAVPAAAAGASGGLLISGSNSGTTTLGALTVTGATTLTGALTSTNASNDLRLGATERGLQRDKIIERTVIRGTAAAGTLSTTQMTTTGMSPAMTAANQLAGQILMFDHDTTTAALRGQKTDITASSAAANPLLTFTALTTAPANGDTFTIG